jgi:hypothetical protein
VCAGECEAGLVLPVTVDAAPLSRETLFDCDYFAVSRLRADSPFLAGAADAPAMLTCTCFPDDSAIMVLEASTPE